MRYKAALELGMEDIWVIQADDLSEKQKQEFIIKDNLISNLRIKKFIII